MRTAKWTHAAVVEFTCPACGEGMEGPSGSMLITEDDYQGLDEVGEITCSACGERLKVPKNPFYRKALGKNGNRPINSWKPRV